jgi:DNA helicase-2/ATP-dependent DNA helicase PcrA
MDYLAQLNPEQRKAVEWGEGPILILAGAGSGKTRVLTRRIAHLIHQHKADPSEIFAVTFTNKAAAEMRHRVFELLGRSPQISAYQTDFWISTFHSACMRILRSDIQHLGYPNPFTIYDDSDQQSLIKACLRELNISDNVLSPKAVQGRINKIKNEGHDPATYTSNFGGPWEDLFQRVFTRYQEVLKVSGALDFNDLILNTVKLFQQFPKILANYQKRFKYLLIDEYQDTNRCQYLLMKLLAGSTGNICAVGDEDQSIYKWRGADITNILNFEKDFPNAKIFKLEQNYRSTKTIIEAASRVIAFNTERRDKELWTANVEGDKIQVIEAYDEHDESLKVLHEITNNINEGISLNEMAVFYRTNAQSRLIEDMLRSKGLQYQVYGGLKFYERLEIKDTLAYLKLIVNPHDDVSFRRIVNVPTRGIGAVSLEKFSQAASDRGVSHWTLLESLFGPSPTEAMDLGRGAKNFQKFYELMKVIKKANENLLPSDLINVVLEETGYRKSIAADQSPESQSRLENLAELRQSIVEFELRSSAETPDKPLTLQNFLEEIALVSGIDKFDPSAPNIKMMTIHMAKGLEFDVVYLVGLEEELFPNVRSWEMEEPSQVEEERRLFYVGMTRARKKLYLYYAKNRTIFGNTHFRVMSRFLEEIPENYTEMKKADYFSRRKHYLERPGLPQPVGRGYSDDDFSQVMEGFEDSNSQEEPDYHDSETPQKGTRVQHPMFGEGIIRQIISQDKVMVEFPGRGVKKISLKFGALKWE